MPNKIKDQNPVFLTKKTGAPMRRQKMSKKSSNRSFKKGMKTKTRNFTPPPTRGGYRF